MNSLTIAPAATVSPVEPGAGNTALPSASAGTAASSTARSGLAYPNPSLRLNPQLGLVVISFYDSSGSVAQTIPNKQQIAAYQQWTQTRQGANPLTGSPGTEATPSTASSTTLASQPQAAAATAAGGTSTGPASAGQASTGHVSTG